MKKKHIFATLAFMVLGIGLTSCSEDLGVNYEQKDELYREMISFKAPVGSNGIYDIYMRYRDDGTASYNLPVLVSGTKTSTVMAFQRTRHHRKHRRGQRHARHT